MGGGVGKAGGRRGEGGPGGGEVMAIDSIRFDFFTCFSPFFFPLLT